MLIKILVLLIFILSSKSSLKYVIIYFRLIKSGIKTSGIIDSFESTNYKVMRNINLPIIRFATSDGRTITGKPVLSIFFELSKFQHMEPCQVYYDDKARTLFIYKSTAELLLTLAFCGVMAAGACWTIFNMIRDVN